MTTYFPHGQVKGRWYLVDATDKVTGRLASAIAHHLRGKHRPDYTRHADMGDEIVVVNVEKIRWTGKKLTDKFYYRHSGYPGGLKKTSLEKKMASYPQEVLRLAVKGMLPRGPLGNSMLRRLRIYVGTEHPHSAQTPEILDIGK